MQDDFNQASQPNEFPPEPGSVASQWALGIAIGVLVTIVLAGAWIFLQRDEAPQGDPLERARQYVAQRKYRAAVIEYKNGLKAEPLNAQARRELGELYLTLGDAEAAVKELRRAGESGYSAAGLLEAWLALGRYEEVLERARELDTDDARINVAAGKALLALARFDEAEAMFEKIAERDPDYGGPKLGRAQLAYLRRDTEAAQRLADSVATDDRAYPDARKLIGEIALEQARYADAKAAFRTALALRPNDIPARVGLARALLGLRETDAAEKILGRLVKSNPRHPDVQFLRAVAARQRFDQETAQTALQQALTADPNYSAALFLWGSLLHEQGNLGLATEVLTRFTAQRPRDPRGYRLLGQVQLENGLPKQAILTLQQALELRPGDAGLLSVIARAYAADDQIDKATEYLERSARLAPEHPVARTRLAVGYLMQGDDERAIAELETVRETAPEYLRPAVLLFSTHLRRGDEEAALALAGQLAIEQSANPLPRTLVGIAREAGGDLAGAAAEYRLALNIDPDSAIAALNLARLELRTGDAAAARRRYAALNGRTQPGSRAHTAATLALARLAYRDGDVDIARRQYKSLVDAGTAVTDALLGLARIADDRGDTGRGVKLLEKARELDESAVAPRLLLANYYRTTGDWSAGLAIADELRALQPGNASVLRLAGEMQLASGARATATGTFTELAELRPDDADPRYLLGLARAAGDDREGARAAYDEALALAPGHRDALLGLATLDFAAGDFSAARRRLDDIRAQHGQSAQLDTLTGDILMAEGRPAEAAEQYDAALGETPSAALLAKLARAHSAAGNEAAARAALEQQIAQRPRDIALLEAQAATLINDDPVAAMEIYERIVEIDPNRVAAINNLAWLHGQRGDEAALTYARKAFELAPEQPEVLAVYGWLLVRDGRAERGSRMLSQALNDLPDNAEVRVHYAAALAEVGETGAAREVLLALDESRDLPRRLRAELAALRAKL